MRSRVRAERIRCASFHAVRVVQRRPRERLPCFGRNELFVPVRVRAAGHNLWKFPGGRGDVGEELGVTAMRDVREETGVLTRFNSLVAFRHSNAAPFGTSDM